MVKLFKSNINQLERVYHSLTIPATMRGSNVILGERGKIKLIEIKYHLRRAIEGLEEIE